MFRCGTGHSSKPREARVMVTTKRRIKSYVNERGKPSEGWEIAEEKPFCHEHSVEQAYLELRDES